MPAPATMERGGGAATVAFSVAPVSRGGPGEATAQMGVDFLQSLMRDMRALQAQLHQLHELQLSERLQLVEAEVACHSSRLGMLEEAACALPEPPAEDAWAAFFGAGTPPPTERGSAGLGETPPPP
eukprot:CAMPEP_0179109716 /NCGR_PEP_ID=MMETSP0796-20121207/51173_1 /TAXON_ID=73915 /ORGANISM="Pyrodinium bahamense, Strain pbaha01" /LENGTH=125 /DNA_ID=CAMNT_0020807835 /DNA_START=28 /DNA_END=402 /DNA_ORIENTATION=-